MAFKVSIVMPVLNGSRYISEAIQSIASQSYTNYELIVVDDGSTDQTRQLVEGFQDRIDLKYIVHPVCKGIPASMNDGVLQASGDLLAFLDHDDSWFPEFLQTQVCYLKSHPETAMVHCDFQTMDVNGRVLEPSVAAARNRQRPSGDVFKQLFLDSFIVGNGVLIRRECFAKLGLFDQSLRWGDYHMWLRIARHYKVDYVAKVLTSYRQHAAQSTRSEPRGASAVDSVAIQAIEKILEAYPAVRKELGPATIKKRLGSLYFDAAHASWSRGAHRHARRVLLRSIRLDPAFLRAYILYAACILPPKAARAIRRMWRDTRSKFLVPVTTAPNA